MKPKQTVLSKATALFLTCVLTLCCVPAASFAEEVNPAPGGNDAADLSLVESPLPDDGSGLDEGVDPGGDVDLDKGQNPSSENGTTPDDQTIREESTASDNSDLTATAEELDPLAGIANGWINNQNGTWSYAKDGDLLRAKWELIAGKWYYLDANGIMAANAIVKVNNSWYIFNPSGEMLHSGWFQQAVGSQVYWFYLNPNGDARKGWQTIGSALYCFTESETLAPYMLTGPKQVPSASNGQIRWHLFTNSGALAGSGWTKFTYDNGMFDWFYTESNGSLARGWKTIGNATYFFDMDETTEPYMYVGWRQVYDESANDGAYRYFADSGAWVRTGWVSFKDTQGNTLWGYLNENGEPFSAGFHKIGSSWYYFLNSPDKMPYRATGLRTVSSKLYLFDDSGVQQSSKWHQSKTLDGNTYWYYFQAGEGADASAVRGEMVINEKEYYFEESVSTPYMHVGGVKIGTSPTWRLYHSDGYRLYTSGWYNIVSTQGGAHWYYLQEDETLARGYQEINGSWYYFNDASESQPPYAMTGGQLVGPEGNQVWRFFGNNCAEINKTPGWHYMDFGGVNRVWWYVDQDGNEARGYKKIGNNWYYFDEYAESSPYMHTGIGTVNGKYRFFDSSGAEVTTTGWLRLTPDHYWYYQDYVDGELQLLSGFQTIKGSLYYFTEASSDYGPFLRVNTDMRDILNYSYSFDASGRALTNAWKYFDDVYGGGPRWCYFDENSRAVSSGKKVIGAKTYYFSDGKMKTGWHTDGHIKYYLTSSGPAATGWHYIVGQDGGDPAWHWFTPEGYLTARWVQDGGFWYRVNNSVMQTNWLTVGANRYYLEPTSGKMLTGWRYIDSADNTEDGVGGPWPSNWYYLNTDGSALVGWHRSPTDGSWYYLQAELGMAHSGTVEIDGEQHRFDASGRWLGEV